MVPSKTFARPGAFLSPLGAANWTNSGRTAATIASPACTAGLADAVVTGPTAEVAVVASFAVASKKFYWPMNPATYAFVGAP